VKTKYKVPSNLKNIKPKALVIELDSLFETLEFPVSKEFETSLVELLDSPTTKTNKSEILAELKNSPVLGDEDLSDILSNSIKDSDTSDSFVKSLVKYIGSISNFSNSLTDSLEQTPIIQENYAMKYKSLPKLSSKLLDEDTYKEHEKLISSEAFIEYAESKEELIDSAESLLSCIEEYAAEDDNNENFSDASEDIIEKEDDDVLVEDEESESEETQTESENPSEDVSEEVVAESDEESSSETVDDVAEDIADDAEEDEGILEDEDPKEDKNFASEDFETDGDYVEDLQMKSSDVASFDEVLEAWSEKNGTMEEADVKSMVNAVSDKDEIKSLISDLMAIESSEDDVVAEDSDVEVPDESESQPESFTVKANPEGIVCPKCESNLNFSVDKKFVVVVPSDSPMKNFGKNVVSHVMGDSIAYVTDDENAIKAFSSARDQFGFSGDVHEFTEEWSEKIKNFSEESTTEESPVETQDGISKPEGNDDLDVVETSSEGLDESQIDEQVLKNYSHSNSKLDGQLLNTADQESAEYQSRISKVMGYSIK